MKNDERKDQPAYENGEISAAEKNALNKQAPKNKAYSD